MSASITERQQATIDEKAQKLFVLIAKVATAKVALKLVREDRSSAPEAVSDHAGEYRLLEAQMHEALMGLLDYQCSVLIGSDNTEEVKT